ncbi:MAG TPA: right-handed parallel beta-helix repeat-containing protein, partial [Herpetosiphonaceae bacterium]
MAYTASSWLRWSTILGLSLSLIFAAVPPTDIVAQEPPVGPAHLDLTNNQLIDDVDALKVLEGWTSLAEHDACTSEVLASRDVNGSGCVDIADVQSVLANWGQSTSAGVPVPDEEEGSISMQATFTVNSAGFEPDVTPGDGQCRTSLNTCTLKAAVDEATNRNGRDTIVFDIRNSDGSCPNLVTIQAPADAIEGIEIDDKFVDGVVIDGYTQCGASPNTRSLHDPNGSNAVIKIELRGNAKPDVHGVEIDSAHNILRGLAIYNWDFAVKLAYSPSFDNRVQGNFLGTDAANNFRYETSAPFGEQHHEGLRIQGGADTGASSNIIGGRTPDTRNIISGNRKDGLKIQGRSTNNLVMGNYIGLKKDGKTGLRNYTDAVDFEYGPQYNTLGGDEPEEGNIISGNYSEGIEISHGTDTQYNRVIGNYFGVSADGTKSVPNTGSGITFEDRVDSNYAYNNVIVNNGTSGIFFFILATRNEVVNNMIGVGPNGTTPMPNGTSTQIDPYYERSGVVIMGGSQHNLIKDNIIANHPGDAIILKNTSNDEHGQYGETFYNTLSQNTTYNNGATEEDDVEGDGIILKPFYHNNGSTTYPNQGIRQPTITAAATNQVRG